MKAYTSLEQSKILFEILPLESADMHYVLIDTDENKYSAGLGKYIGILPHYPCWSLSALLDYLTANFRAEIKYLDNFWELDCRVQVTYNKELVDACYEMFTKLHKQKLL